MPGQRKPSSCLITQRQRSTFSVKRATTTKPNALNKDEIHALLRASGLSTHGLAVRKYAIVQLLLQSGLRIGELNNLLIKDVVIRERSGFVNVVDGKGRKRQRDPLELNCKTSCSRSRPCPRGPC